MESIMNPPTRLLCINCNKRVNKLRCHRALRVDTRVISLVSTWISPIIITEEDFICTACVEASMRTINAHAKKEYAGSSRRGRGKVCPVCGKSLLNRQIDHILKENPSSLTLRIINLIQTAVAPQQISQSDCLCHACWMQFKRKAESIQHKDGRRGLDGNETLQGEADKKEVELSVDSVHVPERKPSSLHASTHKGHERKSSVESSPAPQFRLPHTQAVRYQQPSKIFLHSYKRAPNSASRCAFFGCDNEKLHTVTDSLRINVMSKYKFYIPMKARVCSEHIHRNSWSSLHPCQYNLTDFTVEQVEHVFSFLHRLKKVQST